MIVLVHTHAHLCYSDGVSGRSESVTIVVLLFCIFVVILVFVLMLGPAGIGPLQTVKKEDGSREELSGYLIDSLWPLLQIHQSTQPQYAHLSVMKPTRRSRELVTTEAQTVLLWLRVLLDGSV